MHTEVGTAGQADSVLNRAAVAEALLESNSLLPTISMVE